MRSRLAALLGAGALALGAVVAWGWLTSASPPQVDGRDLEPLVRDAIAAARAQVTRSPRAADAWGHLGMTLHAHGFYHEAREAYAEAERLEPDKAAWPYLIGDCAWSEGLSDDAVRAFQRAATRPDADPVVNVRLGEVTLELGRTSDAVAAFERVTKAQPNEPRARLGLARAALVNGDPQGALTHVRATLASASDAPPALRFLARVLYATGDELGARRALARISKRAFSWPDKYVFEKGLRQTGGVGIARKSRTLFDAGRRAEALELHQEYADRYPDEVEAQVGLGRMYLLMRRPAEAVPPLRAALALNPNLVDVRYSLAAALKDQGNCPLAVEEFRAVIASQPDHADAHFELGRCLELLGEQEAALSEVRRALDLEPSDLEVRRHLGAVLISRGRRREAADVLATAQELAPADTVTTTLVAQTGAPQTLAPK